MSRDTTLDSQEMREAIYDMVTLLSLDDSTFYLPNESPKDRQYPECELEMQTSVQLFRLSRL